MKKSKTKSFVAEVPIDVNQSEEKVLFGSLFVCKRLFNAYLGEALKRLGKMRNSKNWSLARKCKDPDKRRELFKALHEEYSFNEYKLNKRGKPRFKVLNSIENKSNKILALGNTIKTEKLSYKSFQKNYGRSIKVRAPGLFMNLLTYKAERADGLVEEINTQKLKLSQFDHIRQDYQKKPLSLRWHKIGFSEVFIQRDIYSAFLALNSNEKSIQFPQVENTWAIVNPQLVSSGWIQNKTTSVDILIETTNKLLKPVYSSEWLSEIKSSKIDSKSGSNSARKPSSSYC